MAERFEAIELGLASAQFGVREVVAAAEQAEALGFRRVWVAERHLAAGAFAQCGAALARTSRIGLGTGIVSPYSRPPSVMAMEAGALDALSGGRFTLGLGVAHLLRDAMGAEAKPLPLLRKTIEELRPLLSGGESAPSRLSFPLSPRGVPLFVGTMGPRTLEMAGELADGILLNYFISPSFLADALPRIEAGLERAGRALGDIELGSYIAVAVEGDRKRGQRIARQMIAPRLVNPLAVEPKRIHMAGIAHEEQEEVRKRVREAYARGEAEAALRAVPDPWCEKLTIVGPPDACAERLLALARGGLKFAALYMMPGVDLRKMPGVIKEELFPRLL